MSTPLSYASHALNLDKNQVMPTQARKPQPKKAPVAAAAAAAPAVVATEIAAPVVEKPTETIVAAAAAEEVDEPVVASASPVAERPAPPQRTYYSGFAMVKAVHSGDSLVLAGAGGPDAPEKVITLTGVLAPKFGRGKNASDEPYAWEAREYLRKHVIGKQVKFTVQHTHDASGRDYGTVTLAGVDIATQMIKAGWVKVKDGKDGKVHPEKEPMIALEAEAIARGLGIHRKGVDPQAHLRTIEWTPDVQALFAANKGQPIAGVIDQVRDGSTLRVELIQPSSPLKHLMITLNLAGVSCPRTPLPLSVLRQQHERKVAEDASYKGKAPTKEEKAEPFSIEAQSFTETRLLNRDVQVYLQGLDKSGNLFGTIAFAKGNITEKLLQQGFGKLVPWSAALTADAELYRAAEAQAKSQKLRIWANIDDEAAASASPVPAIGEFYGKVINIPSSDSLVVEDSNGAEVRVWLASVRAPRLASRGKEGKDEAYAQEAKEFLRSKLIGHKVRVVPEYVRASAADDKREARTFATVFQNKLSVTQAQHTWGQCTAG